MGGSRSEGNNLGITLSCDEIKEDMMVFYEGKEIRYSTFKGKFPDWHFEADDFYKMQAKKKNVTIWNLVGPKVCKHFNKQNNPIMF